MSRRGNPTGGNRSGKPLIENMMTHRQMLYPMMVFLFLYLASVVVDGATVNITAYRLTPINYTGITNMDTADARGDVLFGLLQLLLPQLCAVDPDFLWCANRQYLSGGNATMVYTQFGESPTLPSFSASAPDRISVSPLQLSRLTHVLAITMHATPTPRLVFSNARLGILPPTYPGNAPQAMHWNMKIVSTAPYFVSSMLIMRDSAAPSAASTRKGVTVGTLCRHLTETRDPSVNS